MLRLKCDQFYILCKSPLFSTAELKLGNITSSLNSNMGFVNVGLSLTSVFFLTHKKIIKTLHLMLL